MSEFEIQQVIIPTTLESDSATDFIEAIDVGNRVEADGYGTAETTMSATEWLPLWLDQTHEPKLMFAIRLDGRIVARAVYETRPHADATMAWVSVQVLPEFRHRGVGTALADRVESVAAADGRTRLVVYTVSAEAPGERLDSPTGFGSVPAGNPEVRFLLARGYRLEQVVRASRLALPAAMSVPSEPTGYRLHQWTGSTPDNWLTDMALLFTRMSTDAPGAGLDEPEDVWTAERLEEYERLAENDGRLEIVSAVEHIETGHLIAMSDIAAPFDSSRAAHQRDTIVLSEHRGHRLGMLLKVANLDQLGRMAPGHPSIVTYNAEENRHMLDVNEAVGFEPIGYEGAWRHVRGT